MVLELRGLGLAVVAQVPIQVYYAGQVVGEYFADLLVANTVLVEIKAVSALAREHEAQLLNYLKAMPYEVGLLLNHGGAELFRQGLPRCITAFWTRLAALTHSPVATFL